MNRIYRFTLCALMALISLSSCCDKKVREANYAGSRVRFNALVYYTDYAEEAHVQFAHQTVDFFKKLTVGDGFRVDTATSLADFTLEQLQNYSVIIAVNAQPSSELERKLFQDYMENGGGWVGFHAAAYNDRTTNWPWFLDFIGGGVFKCNNWPPQPALLEIDARKHPVTKNLPKEFVIPASEYYQWAPEPRKNRNIQVLASLSQKNYPIGLKDIVYGEDWPIVWTNKNYRMIYLNMGHGDEEYTSATQNLLFINALRWIVSRDPKGNPFE